MADNGSGKWKVVGAKKKHRDHEHRQSHGSDSHHSSSRNRGSHQQQRPTPRQPSALRTPDEEAAKKLPRAETETLYVSAHSQQFRTATPSEVRDFIANTVRLGRNAIADVSKSDILGMVRVTFDSPETADRAMRSLRANKVFSTPKTGIRTLWQRRCFRCGLSSGHTAQTCPLAWVPTAGAAGPFAGLDRSVLGNILGYLDGASCAKLECTCKECFVAVEEFFRGKVFGRGASLPQQLPWVGTWFCLVRLDTVRRKIDYLRSHVQEFLDADDFGVSGHNFERNPPLSEAEVSDIEGFIGTVLPWQFRMFVRYVSSWGCGPDYGIMEPAKWFWLFKQGMPDTMRLDSPSKVRVRLGSSGHSNLLSISSQGCTYLSSLVLKGPYKGHILDMSTDDDEVAYLAPQFIEWFENYLNVGIAAPTKRSRNNSGLLRHYGL